MRSLVDFRVGLEEISGLGEMVHLPKVERQRVKVFIAGIMQGSRTDRYIVGQDYRMRIASALEANIPDVQIIDPFQLNPDSVNYDSEQAKETFKVNTAMAAEADVLIAYLPTASMGTAIEMWTAFIADKYIVVVSPLEHNWVIQVTADEVLPDLDSLIAAIENGQFKADSAR